MRLLAVLVVVSASLIHAQRIHHRVVNTPHGVSDTPWRLRASLRPTPDSEGSFDLLPSPDLASDWTQLDTQSNPHALYQLALESDDHHSATEWDIVSVKACQLWSAETERFIFYAIPGHQPYAFSYLTSPTLPNGTCPERARAKPLKSSLAITSPRFVPTPELRAPPPLTPAGQPVQPVTEKSFLQKYWIYFALFTVVILFTGGSEEETSRGGGTSQR